MPRRETPDPLAAKMGARVQTLREERGLSIGALARASGLPKGHVWNLEHGLVMITLPTIAALARAFDVAPGYLITFPEESELEAMFEYLHDLPAEERRKVLQSVMEEAPKGAQLGSGELRQEQRAKPPRSR